jgi:hypothetical protein
MRAMLLWTCQNRKRFQPFDFSGAYLLADMEPGLYIADPPPRWRKFAPQTKSGERMVWRLRKWVCGLRPAGRAWHDALKARMAPGGWKQSSFDGGVFYRTHEGRVEICLLYVDDGNVIAATQERATAIAQEILALFGQDAGTLADMSENKGGWCDFEYVGLRVRYNHGAGELQLNQNKQIQDALTKWTGSGEGARAPPRKSATPVNELTPQTPAPTTTAPPRRKRRPKPGTPATYREAVGSIGYLAGASRPDIAFSHTELARHLHSPKPPYSQLERCLGYLSRTCQKCLVFRRREGKDTWSNMISGYSDADWRSPRSTSGWFVALHGTPFAWSSKTLQTTALSSTESEIVALCSCCKYLRGFANRIVEVFGEDSLSTGGIPVGVDNQSCISISKTQFVSQRVRHLDLQYHYIRQSFIKDHVCLCYVPTSAQRADGLTKPSPERALDAIFEGPSPAQS